MLRSSVLGDHGPWLQFTAAPSPGVEMTDASLLDRQDPETTPLCVNGVHSSSFLRVPLSLSLSFFLTLLVYNGGLDPRSEYGAR